MEEDLEIGIPRQVIKLKSISRKLKFVICLLILFNIFFTKEILLLLFTIEESFGYLSIQLFNIKFLNYYFIISILSCIYRFLYIVIMTTTTDINIDDNYSYIFMSYIIPFIFLKSSLVFHLLVFRDKILQLDTNSLIMIRNIRYI